MTNTAQTKMETLFDQIPLSLIRDMKEHGADWRGFVEQFGSSSDIDLDEYRVIHEDSIHDILVEELESDSYILGCFNASFIASCSNLDIEIIEALQQAEKYDVLGKHLIDNNHVDEIASGYASADGYGHHFAHYDGHEISLTNGWLMFKVN